MDSNSSNESTSPLDAFSGLASALPSAQNNAQNERDSHLTEQELRMRAYRGERWSTSTSATTRRSLQSKGTTRI